jgi:hypothetical protein
MSRDSLRKNFHHVDKKIKFRLRLYFIISIVMVLVIFYDIFKSIISIQLAMLGIIVGIIIGIISARMSNISWDKDANKIVSSLDRFGIIFSVIYVIFAIFRSKLIGFFVHGPVVGAVSFSVVAGVMIGRVIGTRGKIIKVLKEQRII